MHTKNSVRNDNFAYLPKTEEVFFQISVLCFSSTSTVDAFPPPCYIYNIEALLLDDRQQQRNRELKE